MYQVYSPVVAYWALEKPNWPKDRETDAKPRDVGPPDILDNLQRADAGACFG